MKLFLFVFKECIAEYNCIAFDMSFEKIEVWFICESRPFL